MSITKSGFQYQYHLLFSMPEKKISMSQYIVRQMQSATSTRMSSGRIFQYVNQQAFLATLTHNPMRSGRYFTLTEPDSALTVQRHKLQWSIMSQLYACCMYTAYNSKYFARAAAVNAKNKKQKYTTENGVAASKI